MTLSLTVRFPRAECTTFLYPEEDGEKLNKRNNFFHKLPKTILFSLLAVFKMFESHLMTPVPLTVGKVVGGTVTTTEKKARSSFLILVPLLILMLLYDRGSAFIANM